MGTLFLYVLMIFVTICLVKKIDFTRKNPGNTKISFCLKNVVTCLFWSIPVIVIIGNRYMVGTDYRTYQQMFNDYVKWGYYNVETGIIFLFKIANQIWRTENGFFILSTIMITIFSYIGIKRICQRSDLSVVLAILLYLFMYLGPICNIISQMIALAFIILAFSALELNKIVECILFICVAMLFHTSALIFLLLVSLYKFRNGKYINIFLVIIGIISVISILFPQVMLYIIEALFNDRYVRYLTMDYIPTYIYILIYRLPLYLIEILYRRKLLRCSQFCRFWYFLTTMELIGCILGIRYAWIGRIIYFFSIAHIFIDISIVKYGFNDRKNQFMAQSIIVSYYFIAFVFMNFYSELDMINHYTSVFLIG